MELGGLGGHGTSLCPHSRAACSTCDRRLGLDDASTLLCSMRHQILDAKLAVGLPDPTRRSSAEVALHRARG